MAAAAAQSLLRHDNNVVYAPPVPLASPVKLENVVSKEDIEREERRKQLRREISQSITTDTMISPFMQRLSIEELKPSAIYDQNYITLRIEKVTPMQRAEGGAGGASHVVCKCSRVSLEDETDDDDDDDGDDEKNSTTFINVHLYDEYANESLLKVGKILNVAKFKTGPDTPTGNHADSGHVGPPPDDARWVHFDVIVRYTDDSAGKAAGSSLLAPPPMAPTQSSSEVAASSGSSQLKAPMIPFVSITDMIEQPIEPFVEMPPPSPPPQLPNRDH